MVIDVHFPHLWCHLVTLLGLELLALLLLSVGLSHIADPGGLNEVRQLERGLLYTTLALKVLTLL